MPETRTAAEINGQPSHDDLRTLIARALNGGLDLYGPSAYWVVEIGDSACIVSRKGENFQYPYTVAEDGASVTLGTPEPARLAWRTGESAAIQATGALAAREAAEGTLAFVTDLVGQRFSDEDAGMVTTTIEVCRDGEWKHPQFGDIKVTPEMRKRFAENFDAQVRKTCLPIDYDHKLGPAAGWFKALRNEGESLLAEVELTTRAAEQVRTGEYRFFSPEWHPNWEAPEQPGVKHGPTLFGGGLTNRPFFRGMAAICCAEPGVGSGDGGQEAAAGAGAEEEEPVSTTTATEPPAAGAVTLTEEEIAELRQFREQFGQVQTSLTALELENASLRAAEERRGVESDVAALTFGENGRQRLVPEARKSLSDVLMELPAEKRKPVLDAVRGLKFVALGEIGFDGQETPGGEALTASEEQAINDMAARNGQKPEEVRKHFLEARKRRTGK